MQRLRLPRPSWPLTKIQPSPVSSSSSNSNDNSSSNSSNSSSSCRKWVSSSVYRSRWRMQRALLVAACCFSVTALLQQQQQVAADDPLTLIGDWSSNTLRQLQGALAAPLGILRGQQQQPQQQPQQQKLVLQSPYAVAAAGGALSSLLALPQHSSGATHGAAAPLQQQQQQQQLQFALAWGPAVAASNAVAAAERACHQVQLVEGSLRDFTASLAKQAAFREQQRKQQQQQHQQQHEEEEEQQHADWLWEPHECLQPHSFATSVLRALHPQKVKDSIREARAIVAQLLVAAQDEGSSSSRQQQQQQQQQQPQSPSYKDLQHPIPSDFLSRPASLLWAAPTEPPFSTQVTPVLQQQQQQREQQDMRLQKEALKLHEHLEGRLDELETRSEAELASVEAQVQRLLGWADACSMAALGQLNGEVGSLAETVDRVLRANDIFAAEAAALLQQQLKMLGEWPRSGEETADAAAGLLRVCLPAIKSLQQKQQELQQQRAPILERLRQTRSKLTLLSEAAAGIVRQGSGEEELIQGRGSFCQRLLQQRKRLQPPRSEANLLRAHQVHQQKLMEGLLAFADNLKAFVSLSHNAAASRAADGQEGHRCSQLGSAMQQRLLVQQAGYVARLPSAALGLRGGGMQLGSSIQLTVRALQELGGIEPSSEASLSLSRLQDDVSPSQQLLELPPAVLLERIEVQQRRALQEAGTLAAAAAALEATAAARRAASHAAAATTVAAELFEVEKNSSEAAAAAAAAGDDDIVALHAAAFGTSEEASKENEDEEPVDPDVQGQAAHAAAAGDEEIVHGQQLQQLQEHKHKQQQQQQQHEAVAALEAATLGLVEGAEALASDVRRRLAEAASSYGKAQQLTAAAVAMLARSSELKACRYKERERQEQRLLAEGVLEQKRLHLRRQALSLAAYAAASPRRTSR
ncbi:hypothetical protein Emag_004360 [Eimeria magna]